MNRVLLLLLLLLPQVLMAGEVHVAVAANFTAPMEAVVAGFSQESGHKVTISSGSTGKFYAQISNGAPYEVLLAADSETPAKLASDGLAVAESQFTYAIGTLVLWSPTPGLVDNQGALLRTGTFKRLAIANPGLAPYGKAAMETLANMNLTESVTPKLVQGENIAQAYQFVASGSSEIGFVALSQVMKSGKISSGSAWIVPETQHAPIRQDAILLQKGKNNPAAKALVHYLRGEKARKVIASYGYTRKE
jgi:molybdate transport system substrate-binding protein